MLSQTVRIGTCITQFYYIWVFLVTIMLILYKVCRHIGNICTGIIVFIYYWFPYLGAYLLSGQSESEKTHQSSIPRMSRWLYPTDVYTVDD